MRSDSCGDYRPV